MWRRLTRNEVVVCVDFGHIEPLLVVMYVVVIHSVEAIRPWIHKGLREFQSRNLVRIRQERLECAGMAHEPSLLS